MGKINGCTAERVNGSGGGEKMRRILQEMEGIFIKEGDMIGCIQEGMHGIRKLDSTPVAQPVRRIIPTQLEQVRTQVNE